MNADRRPGSSRASAIAEGTSAGLLFLAAPVAGYFLGRWIERLAGLEDWLAWTGGVLGLAAAFTNFFRLAGRLNR
jgi:F0F1-type ATP synthase assembly protein I